MNILKYDVFTDSNDTNSKQGASVTQTPDGTGSGYLAETHYLWGQAFNGTQDVSGSLSNVQSINMKNGDLNIIGVEQEDDTPSGGNIYNTGTTHSDGEISSSTRMRAPRFIGDVTAQVVDTSTIQAEDGSIQELTGDTLTYNFAEIARIVNDTLNSTNITTENLTVTKTAHFFELVIDKIKAAGGAVILSPADGFKVEKAIYCGNHWKLFWKATDGEKTINNMWQIGDQAICQTFNAAEGTSYNVSNKYYWALVMCVGKSILSDGVEYHYIGLSMEDCVGVLNPEVGDEIAMLGHRGSEVARQSAIYISAYNSVDSTLTAPLICHYKGINDFNLSNHKYTWFAANGNTIRGALQVESGESVQDIVNFNQVYLHTAWAIDEYGNGFTKVCDPNITYYWFGICNNNVESDASLTFDDYEWTLIRATGVTVSSTEVKYGVSTSSTTQPTTWSDTLPTNIQNKYLWARTIVTYSDGNSTTSYSVSFVGQDGTSVTISSTLVEYAATTTTTQPTSGWSTTFPTISIGQYIWTRTTVTYSTGNTTQSITVSRIGADGQNGQPGAPGQDGKSSYTHFAYSNSSDGSQNFSTTYFTGALYLGILVDEVEADSTVYSDYTWSRLKGEDGENGEDAEYYRLSPLKEMAQVDASGTLSLDVQYQLLHIVGDNIQKIQASSSENGYKLCVEYVYGNGTTQKNFEASLNTLEPSLVISSLQTNYHKRDTDSKIYGFRVYMIPGNAAGTTKAVDSRFIPVQFDAAATLTITDSITATVQGHTETLNSHTNSISTLEQTSTSITGRIDTLEETSGTINERLAEVELTSDGLTSKVQNIVSNFGRNLLENTNKGATGWGQNVQGETLTVYTGEISNLENVREHGQYVSFYRSTAEASLPSWETFLFDLDPSKIVQDKWYGLSFKFQCDQDITLSASIANNSASTYLGYGQPSRISSGQNQITYAKYYFKAIANGEPNGPHKVYISVTQGRGAWGRLGIWDLKLEEIAGVDSYIEASTVGVTPWLPSYEDAISEIRQTANDISLRVGTCELRLDNQHIVLDADTEVNGVLTIHDNSQEPGFKLDGGDFDTYIQAKSIGTYSSFSDKSINYREFSKDFSGNVNQTIDNKYVVNFSNTFDLGTIQVGQAVKIESINYDFEWKTTGASVTPSTASITMLRGNTNIGTYDITSRSFHLKPAVTGSYSVRLTFGFSLYSAPSSNAVIQGQCSFLAQYPTQGYMLIGNDGIAINFGNLRNIFLGKDESTFNYGNTRLRINENGVQIFKNDVKTQEW